MTTNRLKSTADPGRSEWTPTDHCAHANQQLMTWGKRRDVHWVVRNGRVVIEFRDPPRPSFGERARCDPS